MPCIDCFDSLTVDTLLCFLSDVMLPQIDGATGGSEGHGAVAALVKLVTGGGAGEGEVTGVDCHLATNTAARLTQRLLNLSGPTLLRFENG